MLNLYKKYAIFQSQNTLYICKGKILREQGKYMNNNYSDLMTVNDYVESMKKENAQRHTMITASDYAKSLKAQCALSQASQFITVKEYASALDKVKYSTAEDREIEKSIELSLSKSRKARINAYLLESMLG